MIVLKEYTCNGKKYRIYPPTGKDAKAIGLINHNINAHTLNGNQGAIFNEFASMLALILTPEGMDPRAADREEVRKEILTLPFGFIIEFFSDIVRMNEARGH